VGRGLREVSKFIYGIKLLPSDEHRMYYQYSPDRLSTCTVTVHALLHIADSIEASGPMWAYWAFPMERYCGSLTPAIRSRRFPFPSLDRYITELAQLTQIKMFHQLQDALSFKAPKHDSAGQFSDPACEYPNRMITYIYSNTAHRPNLRVTSSM
jgi:hypothetical protein